MQHVKARWHIGWWLRVVGCSVMLAIMISLALAQQQEQKELAPPSGDPSFISSDAKLELLVKGDDYGIVFTEGAAVGRV